MFGHTKENMEHLKYLKFQQNTTGCIQVVYSFTLNNLLKGVGEFSLCKCNVLLIVRLFICYLGMMGNEKIPFFQLDLLLMQNL